MGRSNDKTRQILKSVGYPEDYLVIDFESYFDADYKMGKGKLSTIEYILDDRFEMGGMGWSTGTSIDFVGGADKVKETLDCMQLAVGKNLEGFTVVAQNVQFDMSILAWKYGIYPPYTIDIKDLHRHIDSRSSSSLRDMVREYGLEEKGETMKFIGLHYLDMTPFEKLAYADYCRQDVKLEEQLLHILLPYLTRPKVELALAHHTLELFTKPSFQFDVKLGRELLLRMKRAYKEAVAHTGHSTREMSGAISFADLMRDVMPEGESIPTKPGKPTKNMVPITGPGRIPAFAKDDAGMQALLSHPDSTVQMLAKARVELKSWPTWIKRMESIGKQSVLLGYFPIPLIYYGGHTGRWSGGEGINVQNLGARVKDLINKIRNTMLAGEGKKLAIEDLSAIEARILAWMAECRLLLEAYEKNEDVYCQFGTKLFRHELYKPTEKTDPNYADYKGKRDVSKTSVLGCGYGMGWETFLQRLVVLESLKDQIDAGKINKKYSQNAIETYRGTYPEIPLYWAKIERAFKYVTKYPGKVESVHPGLTLWNASDTTYIQLPNGRILYYPEARIKTTWRYDRPCDQIRWKYGYLWGGHLTENVDQAMARDILAEALLACEAQGVHIALHVHDELVSVCDGWDAKKNLKIMHECMCRTPDWAKGLPLDSEGGLSDYYTK